MEEELLPSNFMEANDFYNKYKNKPALLLKEHKDIIPQVKKAFGTLIDAENYDDFDAYNNWLSDFCYSCIPIERRA